MLYKDRYIYYDKHLAQQIVQPYMDEIFGPTNSARRDDLHSLYMTCILENQGHQRVGSETPHANHSVCMRRERYYLGT